MDLVNLGRSVELALLASGKTPIDSVPLMVGAGVYAIYYHGNHDLYGPISDPESDIPIYVGKAVPAGGRKGLVDDAKETTALWDRLQEHKESLEQALDLESSDFWVRYLVAVEVFVPLAERVMIKQLSPVWNIIVDGFGNHDPGARRRREGQRPPWDELHPGRWWSTTENMPTPSLIPAAESRRRVRDRLARNAGKPTTESVFANDLTDSELDDFGDLFSAATDARSFQHHPVRPRMVNGLVISRLAQRVASVMSVRPARRRALMARLRSEARTRGPERVRTREWSS
ncbi:Eco29kI family restriction endonuclease, partial [Actinoplanes sp. G11-F43]|uniref:Eco29kI family restriction endonuclease n=1 Tax=Actinoplanes sp. G11-F43 TaxID=3424130 RepID=UPI003D34960F